MSAHHCHAAGCEVAVPPSIFMCLKHWRMVPRAMQKEIWRTYRKGQERTKDPSRAYIAAATAAVKWVADSERAIEW